MKTLTAKNTKQEILDAYNEAIAKLNATATTTIVQEQEAKRVATVKADAKEVAGLNILNPEIVERYKNLDEAISLAKEELESLFGIKAEALSFEALLVAKNAKIAELEEEIKAKEEAIRARVADAEVQYKEIVKRMNNDVAEAQKALEKERIREAEEFTYNLNRERQKDNDAWEDEKARREAMVEAREEAVLAREVAVAEKEGELATLQIKVAEIPTLIEEAYENGKADGKAKEAKSNAITKAHLEKEHDWKVSSLESQIATLQTQLEDVQGAKREAELKLDNAYAEMRALATTTVQSSQVKVIETAPRA